MEEIVLTLKQAVKIRESECKVTTCDFIYHKELTSRFACLQTGTVEVRARCFSRITIVLNPQFILPRHLETDDDKFNYIYLKGMRLYANARGADYKLKFAAREYEDFHAYRIVLDYINNFLDNAIENVLSQPQLSQIIQVNATEQLDYLKHHYICAFSGQVYVSDSTQLSKNCHLLIVVDLCDKTIVHWFLNELAPKASKFIDSLKIFLTETLSKRCKIFHTDRCGSNTETELKVFFNSRNITRSYTDRKHTNQVCEAINFSLKNRLKRQYFEAIGTEYKFEDLSKELQEEAVSHAIWEYNTDKFYCPGSLLKGYSRAFISKAFEFFYKVVPDEVNSCLKLAKTKTEEGNKLYTWMFLPVLAYQVSSKQIKLKELYGIYVPFISRETFLNIFNCLNNNYYHMDEIKNEIVQSEQNIDALLEESAKLKQQNLSLEEIIVKLKGLLYNQLTESNSEKDRLTVEEKIGWLALQEANIKKQEDQYNNLIKKLDLTAQKLEEVNKQRDFFEAAFHEVDEKLTKILERKQRNKIQRNKNRSIQSREMYAVMPQDFPTIMEAVADGQDRFIIAKYRLAHIVLKITGIRISNLAYFNLDQLTNLFNKKVVYIKVIKSSKYKVIAFPFVKGINKYLKYGKEDYEYMLECAKNNDSRLFKPDLENEIESERLRSEIWGNLNRVSFTRYLNNQLKTAARILKKRLTSHSYRRGIGILTSRKFDINVVRQILGHEKITSSEPYVEDIPSIKEMAANLKVIHDITDSRKVDYKVFTSVQEEAIVAELEANLGF